MDILSIEDQLKDFLIPRKPEETFINNLEEKLKKKYSVIVEYPDYMLPIVILSSGLLVGILIMWGLFRLYKLIFYHQRK